MKYTKHLRVFNYTRPRYGAMWHSISYRRGWMPVLCRGRVYNPFGQSIASMRFHNRNRYKRVKRHVDNLRVRMSFKTYNVRHPLGRRS